MIDSFVLHWSVLSFFLKSALFCECVCFVLAQLVMCCGKRLKRERVDMNVNVCFVIAWLVMCYGKRLKKRES